MAELNDKTVESIAALTRASGPAVEVGNIPYVVIPRDAQLVSLEKHVYNEHALRPERINTTVTVRDPLSFIEYFNEYADHHSRIFADEATSEIKAILDYHEGKDAPRWGEHVLDLDLEYSPEWNAWTTNNNRQFTQMSFAEMLEQLAINITSPAPASIIELSRDLVGKSEVEFGGGVRTQSGQISFRYSETIRATVGGGTVEVPEMFTVEIPVYKGGNTVPLQALLRWRLKEGKITFWYTLVRADEAKRAAFSAIVQQIAGELQRTVLFGKVEE